MLTPACLLIRRFLDGENAKPTLMFGLEATVCFATEVFCFSSFFIVERLN